MNEIFLSFIDVMNEKSVFSYIIILMYGLLLGSFLNVVIYRLPIMMNLEYIKMIKDGTELSDEVLTSKMNKEEKKEFYDMQEMNGMNLSFPRSRCGSCGYKIPIWYNIPVLSYLMLKGKCKCCKKSYSPKYLLVEILIGLLWVGSFSFFGATLEFLIITSVTTALIASIFIDLKHRLLPDGITFGALCAGLYFNTTEYAFITPSESIIGFILGYIIIGSVVKTYEKIRNQGMMMGDGDLKLYSMCGAWIGLYDLTFLVLISTILGLLQFIALSPFVKNIKNYQLPFGPAILITFFIFIYFNDYIKSILYSIGY